MSKPAIIIFFTNATHMVFDEEGLQMSELQGSKEATVKALKADPTIKCEISKWTEWKHEINHENMILLLGGELTLPVQPIRAEVLGHPELNKEEEEHQDE